MDWFERRYDSAVEQLDGAVGPMRDRGLLSVSVCGPDGKCANRNSPSWLVQPPMIHRSTYTVAPGIRAAEAESISVPNNVTVLSCEGRRVRQKNQGGEVDGGVNGVRHESLYP